MAISTLMYHGIVEANSTNRYHLSIHDFRRHLEGLRQRLGRAPAVPDSSGAPMTGFALTFDDGHPGWLGAGEELSQLGWKAVFLVVTSAIGRPGELSKDDLRRLASMGHVVGSHTVDHPALAGQSLDFIVRQWSESKAFLEDVLGESVTAAAVPGGYYSASVGKGAHAAGIRHLFTSEPVRTPWREGDCVVYGRFAVLNGMSAGRVADLAAGAPLPCAGQFAAWQGKKVLKSALGTSYLRLREAALRRYFVSPSPSPSLAPNQLAVD